jgi:uncharacterized protein with von Willebrand factor type A (vWA) domain
MEHLADRILNERDLWSAMRDMLQRGAQLPSGRRMAGLRDILERLRDQRQRQLDRYNLSSIMDDIREQLDDVIRTERDSIQQRLAERTDQASSPPGPNPSEPGVKQTAGTQPTSGHPDGQAPDPDLQRLLREMAQKHLDQLGALPPDVGGRIQELREYDFMDPEARQRFEQLLDSLKQQVLQQYFEQMKQALGGVTAEQMSQMRDMLSDLNDQLQAHRRGDDSGFQDFMDKWGQMFPEGLQNAEQLAQHLQQRMDAMRSLMESMTPEMRQELQGMVDSLFQDGGLMEEISELLWNLQNMFPGQQGERFPFRGDEPTTLQDAMRLMQDMHGLDSLERELMDAVRRNDTSDLDADEIGRLVGEEAREMARELQNFARMLEEAGFITHRGKEWILTPRAMRKIGEHALDEIFGRIEGGLTGDHSLTRFGWGAERLDETKVYTYGDPFAIDAQATIRNALRHQLGAARSTSNGAVAFPRPIHLNVDDFEIYQSVSINQCSTVIALDMSTSMHRAGLFQSARKVALALDTLIRTKFPRDMLKVVAFSGFVLPLESHMLLDDYWIDPHGTDIAEALRQSRGILSRQKSGTRQIILITDGAPRGPAARWRWWGDDWAAAQVDRPDQGFYRRGWNMRDEMEEVLQEVARCTKAGIVVNTFMMEDEPTLTTFVKTMTRINSGRVFFADPNHLGEYLIVDYVKNRRRGI